MIVDNRVVVTLCGDVRGVAPPAEPPFDEELLWTVAHVFAEDTVALVSIPLFLKGSIWPCGILTLDFGCTGDVR